MDITYTEPEITSYPGVYAAQDTEPESRHTWFAENSGSIRDNLYQHGAILFRGFGIGSIEEFRDCASLLCPSLHEDYADLPNVSDMSAVYRSTPYPADATIEFHNEGSHLTSWPTMQFFYCSVPAESGGETAVADGRAVLLSLEPEIVEALTSRGLIYVRHFHEGLDVSWREFFHCDDPEDVVAICQRNGLRAEWRPSGALRVVRDCPAIRSHRITGEMVPFHQILLFHQAMLDPATREALADFLPRDEPTRDVRYGDGSAIPDSVALSIQHAYHEAAVPVSWMPEDILLIDNELAAHSRWPYTGRRQLFVAMGEMASDK
jgi:Taurine catabolism dioxygenase TauD, TfdA family